MKISDRIIRLLQKHIELSVKEMVDLMDVSKQATHIAIKKLLDSDKIEKFGRTPKTIYKLKVKEIIKPVITSEISESGLELLNKNFILITELGKILQGVDAFSKWCEQRKLPLLKTINEYQLTVKKYQAYYNQLGIINGNEKLRNTKGYENIYLDDVFYLDFYAIERFGKTKLGTLLHYAKQGQNKMLMRLLLNESREKIYKLITHGSFDAVGIVPPTIRREVQLMKYLDANMGINLPKINIQKVSGIIPVPQKSLSKLEERISNARNTFAINERIKYKHVLLIDDAVGSGSTMNEIAGKIKQKGIAKKVTGLAIVGSFKGFDVITDI